MSKQLVSRVRLIELMNEELQRHPEYVAGLRIYLVPEGGNPANASGYAFHGPFNKTGAFSQAAHAVHKKYEAE